MNWDPVFTALLMVRPLNTVQSELSLPIRVYIKSVHNSKGTGDQGHNLQYAEVGHLREELHEPSCVQTQQ